MRDDLVQKMSKSQIQAEKKELEELKGDLAAKVRLPHCLVAILTRRL